MKAKIYLIRHHSPRERRVKHLPGHTEWVYGREKLCWQGEFKSLKAAKKWAIEQSVDFKPMAWTKGRLSADFPAPFPEKEQWIEVWAVVNASNHKAVEKARLEFFQAEEQDFPMEVEESRRPEWTPERIRREYPNVPV